MKLVNEGAKPRRYKEVMKHKKKKLVVANGNPIRLMMRSVNAFRDRKGLLAP
jgi:hypothetical protein